MVNGGLRSRKGVSRIRGSPQGARRWRMGSGGALPGPDPPVRVELVRQSERTRVTRLLSPEGTVIRKEPLGPYGEHRVRHEVAMLERLRGVAGVAQLAEEPQYQ